VSRRGVYSAAGARRSKLTVAHSNAGGGGERVLWTAIALMQRTEPDVISVVYSGDTNASKEQIIAKAKVRLFSSPSPRATFPSLSLLCTFGIYARPREGQI